MIAAATGGVGSAPKTTKVASRSIACSPIECSRCERLTKTCSNLAKDTEKSNDQAILPALIAHAKTIQARREQTLNLQDRKLRLQDCKLSAV